MYGTTEIELIARHHRDERRREAARALDPQGLIHPRSQDFMATPRRQ